MFAEAQSEREVETAANADAAHQTTLAELDRVIREHDQSAGRHAPADVARALVSKAVVMSRLGRGSEEIAAYEEVIRRFTMSSDAEIVALVAMAQNRRGRALAMTGRTDDALMAFDLAWALATGWKDARLERQAAAALYATGALRKRQGRTAEALSAWGDLVRQFGTSQDAEVTAKLVAGDEARVALLRQSERINEAVRVCNDLVARIKDRSDAGFASAVGFACFTRADCLIQMDHPEAALEACEEATERLAQMASGAGLAGWRAGIGVLRGRAFRKLSRIDDAIAAFAAVDREHAESVDSQVAVQVATALVELGELLSEQAEFAKARAICQRAVQRFADRKLPRLEPLIARAHDLLARTTAGIGATSADEPSAPATSEPNVTYRIEAKVDHDLDMLRGNAAFNAYLEQAKSA